MIQAKTSFFKNPSFLRVLALLCLFQAAGFNDRPGNNRELASAQAPQNEAGISIPELSPEQSRIVNSILKQKNGYVTDNAETLEQIHKLQKTPFSWFELFNQDSPVNAMETNTMNAHGDSSFSFNTYDAEHRFARHVFINSSDNSGVNLKEF